MLDHDAMDESATTPTFPEGTPVYDAAGEKIGAVRAQDVGTGHLVVQKGRLFHQDVHVPLQVIAHGDAGGVHLNLYKDEVLNQDWNAPPVYTAASQEGRANAGPVTKVVDVDDLRVPVREEQLMVGKREGEIGRVHVHKDVVKEQQTLTEPVTREEVHVERAPVAARPDAVGPDVFAEKDFDVPIIGEQLLPGKRTVIAEEVRLHKETVTEDRTVKGTIRRERVTVSGADTARGNE